MSDNQKTTHQPTFKEAEIKDLKAIVDLLANDPLGMNREHLSDTLSPHYIDAFKAINTDPHAHLIVMMKNPVIIGVAQINFITHLTYQGGVRAHIEGVRIHTDYRSQGFGKTLFQHLIDMAKHRGCHMVQLTTDKKRPDAYQFYQQLGFVNSHEGFKLHLGTDNDT